MNWAISVQSQDHTRIIPPRMMNHAKIFTREQLSLPWIEHEIIILFQKLDWKLYGCVLTRTERKQTFPLQQGGCPICLDNDASEAEVITDTKTSRKDLSKMQRTEFTCPQRRNEFWQTESKPSLCTSLRLKNALKKLSKKTENKIVRKTTYVWKGPDVTLRNS